MGTTTPPTDDQETGPPSLTRGEYILPLITAAIEACWTSTLLLGLSTIHLFRSAPILPIWSPFVLLISSCFLVLAPVQQSISEKKKQVRERSRLARGFFSAILICLAILVVWGNNYTQTGIFFNPTWLATLLRDVTLLTPHVFAVLITIILCCGFYYRGVQIASRTIEPGDIAREIYIGGGSFLFIFFIWAFRGGSIFIVLLLLALFLSLTLFARAQAHIVFVRHNHKVSSTTYKSAQERLLLCTVGSICLVLTLLVFFMGITTSPAFLADMQQYLWPLWVVYTWITEIIAFIAVILAAPLFWLLQLTHFQFKLSKTLPRQKLVTPQKRQTPPITSPFINIAASIIAILIVIAIITITIYAINRLLRKRRGLPTRNLTELHESLWSWALFWIQCRSLLRALWQRIFGKNKASDADLVHHEDSGTQPQVRSVREIYRAFLSWSASHEQKKHKSETAYEFKQRLQLHLPQAEPELQTLAEVYTAVRYGQEPPSQAEVERMQHDWAKLQQNAVGPIQDEMERKKETN